MKQSLAVSTIVLALIAICSSVAPAAQRGKTPSKKDVRDLNIAAKLIGSSNEKQRAQGIDKILEFVEKYPSDERTPKAKQLLLENGVGEQVRVRLVDRETISKGFGLTEARMLQMGEGALRELLPYYSRLKPFYKKHSVELVFYESRARYRKETKSIHTTGHYVTKDISDKQSTLHGEVVWYFEQSTGSRQDRETRMKGTLYHEFGHHLNAVYFADLLPRAMNEGLAQWMQARHNKTHYQTDRHTDREATESEARHGLGMIAKYDDFESFIRTLPGFGRGDRTQQRTYGLCYAIVDFFERGNIGGKRASIPELFDHLHRKTSKVKETAKKRIPRLEDRALLEDLVRVLYGTDLREFHKALTAHILKYRQR